MAFFDRSHIIFAARCYASAAYAVMRCLSVCLSVRLSVTFMHSVKTSNCIVKFFHHRVYIATPFYSFLTKRYGNIPMGTPLTGASNAGGVGKSRDCQPICGIIACCEPFERQMQYTQLRRTMAS